MEHRVADSALCWNCRDNAILFDVRAAVRPDNWILHRLDCFDVGCCVRGCFTFASRTITTTYIGRLALELLAVSLVMVNSEYADTNMKSGLIRLSYAINPSGSRLLR
jgi:hypothetical protein